MNHADAFVARRGNPKITVATVVFNGADQIRPTIDSVLSQTYEHIEYIVVDGNSTDGTQAVVLGYGAAVHILVSEPDRGIYDGMNKAVALATGDFILFMNSGDIFADPGALAQLVPALSNAKEQVLFGCWIRRRGSGRDAYCVPSLETGTFNHQAILYSRSIHQWHGDYVVVPGLTTADYLFFATLIYSGFVSCRTTETVVSIIDVSGVSAGPQTFSQKQTVDYLCGRMSRPRLLGRLAAHSIYYRLKRSLPWQR